MPIFTCQIASSFKKGKSNFGACLSSFSGSFSHKFQIIFDTEYCEMLRQRLSEKYSKDYYYPSTPRTHNLKEEGPVLSERRLSVFGLIFCVLVIAGKVFTLYRKYFLITASLTQFELGRLRF